jgi:hypothetical protein
MGELTDPDLRVPEASVEEAWRLATTLTNDHAIGVHLVEALPRGALDLVEFAFRSSASLALALERLVRYGRVVSDRVAARVDTNDKALLLAFDDVGITALHPGRAEFALAAALNSRGTARDTTSFRNKSASHIRQQPTLPSTVDFFEARSASTPARPR